MNLNLGCGEFPITGYVNVDARQLPGVDVVADVRSLPPELTNCEHVYAGHILEHMRRSDGMKALAHWWERVASGGDLTVVIPDCARAAQSDDAGVQRMVFLGDPSSDLTRHYAWWTVTELWLVFEHFLEVAFYHTVYTDHRFVAHVWWQSAVRAVKR